MYNSLKFKPNILFVFSDQHRWCDMGCYGNHQVETPNFDKFALKGVRFNNCISNYPLCVPARGSLLTGLFPLKHGAVSNDLPISHDVTSIAHVLNANGYNTGYVGKWHLAGVPRDQYIPAGKGRLGFKEWKVCNCNHAYMNAYYYDEKNNRVEIDGYEPVEQTNLAVDFIERNGNDEKPWCLYLSWGPPHDPYYEVPKRYLEIYEDKEIGLRKNVPETIKDTLWKNYTQKDILKQYKGYYAHITALDEQFGRLVKALEDTGQLDNTVVVYTSDHGDMLGSQGVTNKQWPYEESIKVPLLVYWSGRTLQMVRNELIGLVDLPVSLLGLMGLKFPREVDGQDLHQLFVDKNGKGLGSCYIFDYIPCHQAIDRGSTEWRGIRTQRYTYARTAYDEGFILFDNIEDPLQMDNLIDRDDRKEIKDEMKELLDKHITKYDQLLPWEDLIQAYGLKEEWNKSQTYFKRPVID